MSQKLISLRVELSKRLADAQAVGRSRELSLAVTSIQSARMLFGSVALILGSVNPYPEADKPASAVIHPSADLAVDYVPPVPTPEGQVSMVKYLRVAVQLVINDAVAVRSELWARPYASAISITAEVLFDRALTELFLAKQWLGEQLAVIGGHALVKTSGRPEGGNLKPEVPDTVRAMQALVEKADAKDVLIIAGILVDKLGLLTGERPITFTPVLSTPELEAAIDGLKETVFAAQAPEGLPQKAQEGTKAETAPEGLTADGAEGADGDPESTKAGGSGVSAEVEVEILKPTAEQMDELIAAKLTSGVAITEICRTLDVTEYRVTKIKKAMLADGSLTLPATSGD